MESERDDLRWDEVNLTLNFPARDFYRKNEEQAGGHNEARMHSTFLTSPQLRSYLQYAQLSGSDGIGLWFGPLAALVRSAKGSTSTFT